MVYIMMVGSKIRYWFNERDELNNSNYDMSVFCVEDFLVVFWMDD